ncbi:MAG: hypothetical protein WDZ96_00160 [Acidimicrobiia bacterium]
MKENKWVIGLLVAILAAILFIIWWFLVGAEAAEARDFCELKAIGAALDGEEFSIDACIRLYKAGWRG